MNTFLSTFQLLLWARAVHQPLNSHELVEEAIAAGAGSG